MISSKDLFLKIYQGKFILISFQIIAIILFLLFSYNSKNVYQTKIVINTLFYNSLITENKLNALFLTNLKKEENYINWKNLDNPNIKDKSLLSFNDVIKIAKQNVYSFLQSNELLITDEFVKKDLDIYRLKSKSKIIEDLVNFIINITESEIRELVQMANLDTANSDFQILNNFDSKLIISGIDIYNSKIIYNSKKIKPNSIYIAFVISFNLFILSLLVILFRKK